MKTKLLFILLLLSIMQAGCSCARRIYIHIAPFVISTFSNENVYKTKTDLKIKKAYNLVSSKVEQTDTIRYTLSPDQSTNSFLRYKIIKDGDKTYIRILPGVRFLPTVITVPVLMSVGEPITVVGMITVPWHEIEFSSILPRSNNPSDYYFETQDKLVPNSKYLAQQSIVGMPLTMPFKISWLKKKAGDFPCFAPPASRKTPGYIELK